MQTSEVTTGDAREVFEILLAGDKIEISFFSQKEFEAFRVRLYQVKKSITDRYVELGMLSADDVQSLIFDKKADDYPTKFTYLVYLGTRKREAQQFKFRIVSDE